MPGGNAMIRGAALAALAVLTALLAVAQLVALVVSLVGLVFAFHPLVEWARWLPERARRLAGDWSGVPVATPYRPRPPAPTPDAEGRYLLPDGNRHTSLGWATFRHRMRWAWTDPATWRDLLWFAVDPVVGGALAALPLALLAGGVVLVVLGSPWVVVAGVAAVVLAPLVAPWTLRLHGRWTAVLLAPLSAPALARARAVRRWFAVGLRDAGHGVVITVLSLAALPIAITCVVAVLGGRSTAAGTLAAVRWLPERFRRFGTHWFGLDLPTPYATGRDPREDPATWRDLWFLLCQSPLGLPSVLPAALFCYGVWGLVAQVLFNPNRSDFVGELFGSVWLGLFGGIVLAVAGAALGPVLLRPYRGWLPVFLAPTREARLLIERERLVERVERLTESRADATDTQAAEVRRIERDLHDGTQARLVALGMALGAAEALIDRDPAAAKALLARTRDSSASALVELRGLIQGIHPPVLAERGLVDAIRALALDSTLRVEVRADLPGRAQPPIESAVYFAVAELLTNAAKHSGADRGWVDLRHNDGMLRVSVLDDGRGGADPDRGSGLRGLERRLGTFDGRVTVSSPPGGPTMVTMELPCALSSPRTSTSSETA